MAYPKGTEVKLEPRPLLCAGCDKPLGLKWEPPAVRVGNNYIHASAKCLRLVNRKGVKQ